MMRLGGSMRSRELPRWMRLAGRRAVGGSYGVSLLAGSRSGAALIVPDALAKNPKPLTVEGVPEPVGHRGGRCIRTRRAR